VRVSRRQGAAVPEDFSCDGRGILLKKCRMFLLFDEPCRFMAVVNCAAPTRDALLIEWGGLGMLGLHANPTARSHGTGSCASIELREPKDGHDACGRRPSQRRAAECSSSASERRPSIFEHERAGHGIVLAFRCFGENAQ
jgi:hypothetical protein